jgi:non-ribosomal peptide synthetase component E (peptide arylation enzyme)
MCFDVPTSAHETLCCIERERVSVTNLASSMVPLLLDTDVTEYDLSPLRMLSCGGSPPPPNDVVRAIAAFGCPFFVSYGGSKSYRPYQPCKQD